MKYVIGIVALAAFFAIAVAQISAGYAGISHGIGAPWALVAVLAAVRLHFTPPIVIGAFFGAMQMWGWHWILALLFTLPGVFFMLPGSIAAVASLATEGASKLTRSTPICAEH